MMKVRFISFLTALFILVLAVSAARADTQEDIDRAVSIIERFSEIPETAIPPAVLREPKAWRSSPWPKPDLC
jgi:hypothetical protein